MTAHRIAIVEDNDDNRLLLRALLSDGYDLVEYATGRSALEGLLREVPAVILMDISLPDLDGPKVLQALRKDERYSLVPVVAITAHAMVGDRERLLAQGFDDYVSKPILDEHELIDTIERLIARTPQ